MAGYVAGNSSGNVPARTAKEVQHVEYGHLTGEGEAPGTSTIQTAYHGGLIRRSNGTFHMIGVF